MKQDAATFWKLSLREKSPFYILKEFGGRFLGCCESIRNGHFGRWCKFLGALKSPELLA